MTEPPPLDEQKHHRIVFKNGMVVPVDASQEPTVADVLVSDDGRIACIGTRTADEIEDTVEAIDVAGKWLLPGFVSAHSHLWQHGFPGHVPDSPINDWAEEIYRYGHDFTAVEFYRHTFQGASSHIRKGITTAFNFTDSPRLHCCVADRAQFAGSNDSGIRFLHGFNLGGVSLHWSAQQSLARARRFLDWASTSGHIGQYLGSMIANHGIGYETSMVTHLEAGIMRQLGLRGHLHYLESPLAADVGVEQSRWQWLKDAGLVSPDLILGHFLHPTLAMIQEAGAAGMSMSWNPMSNGRLGSGIAAIPEYRKQKVKIGLGVDGEASSDRCDPFENMRTGLYSVRGKYKDPAILSTHDVFYMHTQGAADVLGVGDTVGSLTVGKFADIVVLEPPPAATVPKDVLSALVLASGVEDIRAVYIGGIEYWPQRPSTPEVTLDWQPWTFPPE